MFKDSSLRQRIESFIGTDLEGRYEIHSILGHGGMGVVYKATHRLMHRTVAIKMILNNGDDYDLQRFKQEARAAAALKHPNIITVYDFGTDPYPFLVMDFLEGHSLSEILKVRGPLPQTETIAIFCQICDALSHAHKKGVIHRDLKPSNIMLVNDDEQGPLAQILDFGLARLIPTTGNDVPQLTQPGSVFGTPHYMSPEQCMGLPVDARSDIYALGCIMYEMLTGELAFKGENILQVLQAHIGVEPLTFDKLNSQGSKKLIPAPLALEKIVFNALAKKPDERQQSMAQLRLELLKLMPQARSSRLSMEPPAPEPKSRTIDSDVSSGTYDVSDTEISSALLPASDEHEFLHSLDHAEKTFGHDSEDAIQALEALARYYYQEGQYELAKTKYEELLALATAKYGEQALFTAEILDDLGTTNYVMGADEEAIEYRLRARAAYGALRSEPGFEEAWLEYYLFRSYDNLGDSESAAESIERAIQLQQDFVKNNSDLCQWCIAAGDFYQATGDEDLAKDYFHRALSTAESVYGDRHEALIAPNLRLGKFYDQLHDTETAEPYIRRATNIAHKTLPPQSQEFAATLYEAGQFYYNNVDYAKAMKCFKTTLSIEEKNGGHNSLELISSLHFIAVIHQREESYQNAEIFFQRALRIIEQHEGSHSDKAVDILIDFALSCEAQRKDAVAEEYLKRALSIARHHFTETDQQRLTTPLSELGRFYLRKRKFDRSEKLLTEALDILEDIDGYVAYSLILPLRALAELYTFIGKLDEARRLERRANRIEEGAA